MAWYEGTYACGHEGRVNVIGPNKQRQWKIDRHFEGLCSECYAKKREEEIKEKNKQSIAKSADMELPGLLGSEKQVAWAQSLRLEYIDRVDERLESSRKYAIKNERIQEFDEAKTTCFNALEYFLRTKTEAKFWIDNRNCFSDTFSDMIKEYESIKDIPTEVVLEQKEEMKKLTVKPAEEIHTGVVVMKLENDNLEAHYPKSDEFRKIVKSKYYRWEGVWTKLITNRTGSAIDCEAELGNVLLANGFAVRFTCEQAKNKAVDGSFIPECHRWILFNKDQSKFSVFWREKNDTLYYSAMKLHGAKYREGRVMVPLESYKEIQDYAETFEFSFSQTALDAISEYTSIEAEFETKAVKAVNTNEVDDAAALEKKLKYDGVIEDLKDET